MIENILKETTIPYKVIDENKAVKLMKINSKLHLLYIKKNDNQFVMEREYFNYLDGNSIPYSILFHDTSKNFLYYLKLNKEVNWIKSCFETCNKESIFLGKQVLNEHKSVKDVIEILMNFA